LIIYININVFESNEKKLYLLMQLKSFIVYYKCLFIFFIINLNERHFFIALYYIKKEINVNDFIFQIYNFFNRLKIILKNFLTMIEYFYNIIKTIIDICFKKDMFEILMHYYDIIEYQNRFTSHILL